MDEKLYKCRHMKIEKKYVLRMHKLARLCILCLKQHIYHAFPYKIDPQWYPELLMSSDKLQK